MIALIFFLVFCQAFGAFIGAFTALWGEVVYMLAMRDGKIDAAERAHLRAIGNGLRFGMMLLLLASLALVIISYALHGALQPALTASYWVFITLALLIIIVSWALARKKISFAIGSAICFTAWWFLTFLTLGLLSIISYGAVLALFTVLVAVCYAVLYYAHLLVSHKKGKATKANEY
jgi:hypothetical protein